MRPNRRSFPATGKLLAKALESRLLLSVGLFSADQDIGSPAQAGSAIYADGGYSVVGGGNGAGGSSDQFHFTYESFAGDGLVVAKVNSLANTSSARRPG